MLKLKSKILKKKKNMKLSVQLLIIVSLATVISAFSKNDAVTVAKKVAEGCKKTEGASDEDIETLLDDSTSSTPKAKCLIACLFSMFLIINYYT